MLFGLYALVSLVEILIKVVLFLGSLYLPVYSEQPSPVEVTAVMVSKRYRKRMK